jgi:hypothetical protein
VADDSRITEQAQRAFNRIHDQLSELGAAEFVSTTIAALVYGALWAISEIATIVGYLAVTLGAPLLQSLLEGVEEIRNDPSGGMNDLVGSVMNEFFGSELDTSNISIAKGSEGLLERSRAVGKDIYGILEGEFAPDGVIDEAQGVLGAEAFVGFAANFSVRTAFLGIIGEMASLGILTDMRQLGEELAKSLGLGRLVRQALAPLVHTTIATPLTWSLNRQYRPKRLAEADLIKGYRAKQISAGDVAEELKQQGYRDVDIAIILNAADRFMTANELATLIRYGDLDKELAIQALLQQGYDHATAVNLLLVEDLKRADSWLTKLLGEIQIQHRDGFIDDTQLDDMVKSLPVGEVEGHLITLAAQHAKGSPRRLLTLATLELALEHDVIDISEFEDWLKLEGYSDDERVILLNLTLIKAAKMKTQKGTKPSNQPPGGGTPTQ